MEALESAVLFSSLAAKREKVNDKASRECPVSLNCAIVVTIDLIIIQLRRLPSDTRGSGRWMKIAIPRHFTHQHWTLAATTINKRTILCNVHIVTTCAPSVDCATEKLLSLARRKSQLHTFGKWIKSIIFFIFTMEIFRFYNYNILKIFRRHRRTLGSFSTKCLPCERPTLTRSALFPASRKLCTRLLHNIGSYHLSASTDYHLGRLSNQRQAELATGRHASHLTADYHNWKTFFAIFQLRRFSPPWTIIIKTTAQAASMYWVDAISLVH